jgi:hypothetical protein
MGWEEQGGYGLPWTCQPAFTAMVHHGENEFWTVEWKGYRKTQKGIEQDEHRSAGSVGRAGGSGGESCRTGGGF